MSKVLLPSARVAIAAAIDPDAAANGTYTSAWVSMSDFQSVMAVILAGTIAGTLNAKLEQASDAAGTGAKDIADKAITALAAGDSDSQAVINCFADDLDLALEFTHVRLSMTVAGGAADCGASLMGFDARYEPASNSDAATVAEIIE